MLEKQSTIVKLWSMVTDEKNNRGITLILLFFGFILALWQIRNIQVNLEKIQAGSIETRKLYAPPGQPLGLGKSRNGDSTIDIVPDSSNSIIQLGSAINPDPSEGCISFKIKNSIEFVHLSPNPNDNTVVWKKGNCH